MEERSNSNIKDIDQIEDMSLTNHQYGAVGPNTASSSSSSDSLSSSSGDSEGKAWSINTNDALDMVQKGIKLDYTDTFAPFPSPTSSIVTVAPKEISENLNSFGKQLINHEDNTEDYGITDTKFFRNNTIKRFPPKNFSVPIKIPDDEHVNDFKLMREKSIIRHSKIKSHSDLAALGNNTIPNKDIGLQKHTIEVQSATDLTRLNRKQLLNSSEKTGIQKNKKDVSFANSRKNKSTTSFLSLFSKSKSKVSLETNDIINADQKAEFNPKTLNSIKRKDKTVEDIKAHKKEGFLQRRREKKEKKKEMKRKREILLKTYRDNNEFPDIPPAFLLNPDAKLLHVPEKVLENAERSFPHTIKRGTFDTEDFLEFSYVPFSKSDLNIQETTKRYSAPVMPMAKVPQSEFSKNSMSELKLRERQAKRNTLPVKRVGYQNINSVIKNKENITPRSFESSKSHNDLNSYGKEASNLGKNYSNDTSNYRTNVKIISNENINREIMSYNKEKQPQLRHTGTLKNKRMIEKHASNKLQKNFPGSSSASSLSKRYQFRSDGKINNAIMDDYSSGEEDEENSEKLIQRRKVELKNDIFCDVNTDEGEGLLMNNHHQNLPDSRASVAETPKFIANPSYPTYSSAPIPSHSSGAVFNNNESSSYKNFVDKNQKNKSKSLQNSKMNTDLHIYDSTVRPNPRKTKFTLGSLDDDDEEEDEDDESFYDAASIQFNGSSIDEFKNPAALTTGMLTNNNFSAIGKSSKNKRDTKPKELNRLNTFNSTAVRINYK